MQQETDKMQLFYEYYKQWIEVYKKGAIRDATMAKYLMTQKWVEKLAPELKVCELTRTAYQKLLNDYAKDHERQTTLDFHHQLKGAILDAVDEGMIERDPTRKAIIKGKTPRAKKIKYLNQFELHTLIAHLDIREEVNWDWFILLVAKTGMRFSEALAITPSDFDFARQTLSISKTWDYKGNGGFLPTKNNSSVRKIQIDWQIVVKFSELTKNLPEDKPIFVGETKIYNSTVNDVLTRHCKACGISEISIHGLRHTHAYFISEDTSVSAGGHKFDKVAFKANLEIREMSTELRIYSPYSIDLPAASTDEVITTVDIGNVWKNLDSTKPVAFTAEVNPNNSACSGKVEIVEEAWEKSTYGESTPITDVIKSTDTPRNPIAGGEYWYSIVLRAKEGYVFSDNVTFICEGKTYTAQTANTSVSDNGKTFTAWEFLLPVIASDGADDTVIKDVEVISATLSYDAGDTPKATAVTKDIGANYEIAYESWEDEQHALWYSDEHYYPSELFLDRFTSFEEGKSYRYSILLKAKNGRTFAATDSGLTVTVNGWTVE